MNQLSSESGGTYHLAKAIMHCSVCCSANHVSSTLGLGSRLIRVHLKMNDDAFYGSVIILLLIFIVTIIY